MALVLALLTMLMLQMLQLGGAMSSLQTELLPRDVGIKMEEQPTCITLGMPPKVASYYQRQGETYAEFVKRAMGQFKELCDATGGGNPLSSSED